MKNRGNKIRETIVFTKASSNLGINLRGWGQSHTLEKWYRSVTKSLKKGFRKIQKVVKPPMLTDY